MQASNKPPIEEILFLPEDVLDWEGLFALPTFQHADVALARHVLDEGARLSAEVIAPVNSIADQQACRLEAGRVITTDVFKPMYEAFVDGGWLDLDQPDKFGRVDVAVDRADCFVGNARRRVRCISRSAVTEFYAIWIMAEVSTHTARLYDGARVVKITPRDVLTSAFN